MRLCTHVSKAEDVSVDGLDDVEPEPVLWSSELGACTMDHAHAHVHATEARGGAAGPAVVLLEALTRRLRSIPAPLFRQDGDEQAEEQKLAATEPDTASRKKKKKKKKKVAAPADSEETKAAEATPADSEARPAVAQVGMSISCRVTFALLKKITEQDLEL